MTDHTHQEGTQQPIGFGNHLRSARETLQISPKDAAARLHLNPRIIHIIEQEDFANGPPAIFMRGYLRSYAKLLNISNEMTNAALQELNLQVQASNAAPPRLKEGSAAITNERYITLGTCLVMSVLAGLVGIWWKSHSHSFSTDLLTPAIAQQTTQTVLAETTPKITVATPVMAPTSIAPATTITAPSAAAPVIAQNTAPAAPILPSQPMQKKAQPSSESIPSPNNLEASLPEPGLDIYE